MNPSEFFFQTEQNGSGGFKVVLPPLALERHGEVGGRLSA